jgi:hypothetical protein
MPQMPYIEPLFPAHLLSVETTLDRKEHRFSHLVGGRRALCSCEFVAWERWNDDRTGRREKWRSSLFPASTRKRKCAPHRPAALRAPPPRRLPAPLRDTGSYCTVVACRLKTRSSPTPAARWVRPPAFALKRKAHRLRSASRETTAAVTWASGGPQPTAPSTSTSSTPNGASACR